MCLVKLGLDHYQHALRRAEDNRADTGKDGGSENINKEPSSPHRARASDI